MDERDYNHLKQQPDTYPKEELLGIRAVLATVDPSAARVIDKVRKSGYLEPPAGTRTLGWYRVLLTEFEREQVLAGLMQAREELAKQAVGISSDTSADVLAQIDSYTRSWRRTMTETPVLWDPLKAQRVYYDLRTADLDEFEAFVFDHEKPTDWYHDFDLEIDFKAARNAELFIELFQNSGTLPDRYSPEQIERACWAVLHFDGNVNELIWRSKLDIMTKERLIEAMFDLYANLFDGHPELFETHNFGSGCNMWWDDLAYNFNPMNIADPENNEEHRRIQNAMFRTLTRILDLESEDCQAAALHGLNHVVHPDTKPVVLAYLEKHPELSEQERALAIACAHGEMQ